MTYDITALGEILIDFVPSGTDDAGDSVFARKAGGAPVNMLAAASAFGGNTAFIGKVGNDMFGRFLGASLRECGISADGLVFDGMHATTLTFVELDENGDRDFVFLRENGADRFLRKEEVNTDIIKNSKMFHFGSLSLTNDPSREATEYALDVAKKAGCVITYDPNYRAPLWKDRNTAIEMMKKHLDKVDILKISADELEMMFGSDEGASVKELQDIGVKVILVTDGAERASVYLKNGSICLPSEKFETVDTTGAGDIFFGTFLGEWLKNGSTSENITPAQAAAYLKKAVHVAGKSTEQKGAIAPLRNIERLCER